MADMPETVTAPSVPLEDQIVKIVRELLVEQGKDRAAKAITPKSSFQNDLGLSSLDLVELVVRCETRLDIEVPEEIAEQADTAAGWAKAIKEGSEQTTAKSAYRIAPPSHDVVALPVQAKTLVDVLRWHAQGAHGRVHIHLIHEGDGRAITCDQLLSSASQAGRGLVSLGLVRNDPVAILLPTGGEFFDAFFGVMLAGGIPVPIYPPADGTRIAEYVEKQIHILRNAGIRFLISFDEARPIARLLRINLPSLIDITTVGELHTLGSRTSARFPEPSSIAMVQYTSGTTESPRGATLTHDAVLANVRAIGAAVQVRPGDAVVSWLPIASDLGLVGCWLFSLYHATPLTLLTPQEFSERPESWLWAIHDSRATLSAAPNFAYDMAARKIPAWAIEGLDLSSWRVAINAGEAVMADTIEQFARRYRPYGFRREALMPSYGLSENSVGLCIPPVDRGPIERDGVYSVGPPLGGHEVRILDEFGRLCRDGEAGRLQFRGASQMRSYWNNDAATAAVTKDGWIDTGDVAFEASGEVYIVGRSKDVIIRNGRQLPVEPIETAVEAVAGIKLRGVAIVGTVEQTAGTEKLVVLAECTAEESEQPRVLSAVRNAVRNVTGEEPDSIHLIPPGTLPRTANQKIRRVEARRLAAQGEIGVTPAAPAFQMAGLWIANTANLVRRGTWKFQRAVNESVRELAARFVGGLMTLAGASGAVQPAVRTALKIMGKWPTPEGTQMRGPVVIISQRSNPMDAMSVVSARRKSGDARRTRDAHRLAEWAASMLKPLVVDTREGMEAALEAGRTLVVFPDSPLGTPVPRLRYHLRALEAAVNTGAPIVPLGMQIIRNRLFFRVAEKIPAAGADARELRRRVRDAIQNIYA
jgi:acyl carrier protein